VRAQAVPLVALVAVLCVLIALRVRAPSPERPARLGATSANSTKLVVRAPPPIARAVASGAAEGAAPHSIHEDAHHTHRARGLGPTTPKLAWKSDVGGAVEAQVVASPDERTLYVSSLDGGLTALDAASGARRWRVALGNRAYATPCVAPDGTIYAGSDTGRFVAVHPDGSIVWTLETDGEADTGATLTKDGLVVFAAGSHVYAVRAGGDVAWRFDAKKKVFTAPAIADDGTVVVGSQDDHVYALDAKGALRWSVDLGADVDGAPVIGDDGAVYVGDDAGEVVRIDARGTVAWRTQVGGFVRGPLSLARSGDVLAGVYGPTPQMVRMGADGAVRGSLAVRGTGAREFGVQGGALEDASGALYFGAQDDEVHAIGPEGAWEWSYVTGADVDAPLTLLSSGALVAGSDDGNVYLFAR
jgi:outer membrane protein assembly factor BamB